MTTKEAFLQLTHQRKWYEQAGITEGAAKTMAKRVRDGAAISIEKMEEVLEKAGFVAVQEKIWIPKDVAEAWSGFQPKDNELTEAVVKYITKVINARPQIVELRDRNSLFNEK